MFKIRHSEPPPPPPSSGARTLEALLDLAGELLRLEDHDTLLDVLVEQSLEILNGERGFLMLLQSGKRPDFKVVRNWRLDELGEADPVSRSITADALRRGEPILVEDAASDLRYSEMESVLRHRIRSVLAAPLTVDGEAVGVLYLESRVLRRLFDETSLETFRRILDFSEGALKRSTRLLVLEERNRLLQKRYHSFPDIVTHDSAFVKVLKTVAQVATTDTTVLIQGDSGTGKELVARGIHDKSERSDGPFVVVNCGAVPPDLIESELFGHVRGAFTGADKAKIGLLEAAENGTLFLDEIGELPLPMQPKLLRAIQFGEIRPVGSSTTSRVDVRIVSATNRDLEKEVREGRFRQDLLYRLNVVTVQLPPLRERPDDILPLFYTFLERAAVQEGRATPEVPSAIEEALVEFDWPGNVRQLENEANRLLALTPPGGRLSSDRLSAALRSGRGSSEAPLATLEEEERRTIERHLKAADGNKSIAAKTLGISREGLRKKMARKPKKS